MAPAEFTVTTANICGNPIRPRAAVRARMDKALSHPGVVFGQECAASNKFRVPPVGNYSHAWHRIATAHGKATEGGAHEVPVSLDSAFAVVGANVELMHLGKRGVSPNRFATIVKTTVGGHSVAFINCHTVSQPRLNVPFGRWRVRMFQVYIAKLAAKIAELHGEGFTVVFGGDMNHPAPLHVYPGQQILIERGLDHLWIVPADGTSFTVTGKQVTPRTALMDHPILSVSVQLT